MRICVRAVFLFRAPVYVKRARGPSFRDIRRLFGKATTQYEDAQVLQNSDYVDYHG